MASVTPDPRAQARDLMAAGEAALARGDRGQAHAYWQQAAHLQPKDEAVWLALLQVVEDPRDRRTCLENVLRINPANQRARRQLKAILARPSAFGLPADAPAAPQPGTLLLAVQALLRFGITMMVLLGLFALGMAIGVLLNLL